MFICIYIYMHRIYLKDMVPLRTRTKGKGMNDFHLVYPYNSFLPSENKMCHPNGKEI